MNTTAGILAGILVAGAAVSAYRFARRKAGDIRAAIDEIRGASAGRGDVIEFEKDPQTGIYRQRG